MKVGDSLALDIIDVAYGGAGVGRHEGMAVFVPFTIEGERVTARVRAVKRRHAEADPTAIPNPSPHRVTPPCRWFGRCGGCQYQHMAYPRQCAVKAKQLRDLLQRIGGIETAAIEAMQPSPLAYGYRNKITLHGDRARGFVARDNHTILPIEHCPIASPAINDCLEDLTRHPRPPGRDLVVRSAPDGQARIYAAGAEETAVVEENILGRTLQVPLQSFFQVNPGMADRVVARVRAVLEKRPHAVLVDAYCGSGLFGLLLADLAREVVGIETDAAAIAAARQNAQRLGLTHCRFTQGAAELRLDECLAARPPAEVCLLLDPPRTGCDPRLLRTIERHRPRTVVYVSCNPPVLARDLRALLAMGYRLEGVAPFEMFPQTAPFEVVAVAERDDALPRAGTARPNAAVP